MGLYCCQSWERAETVRFRCEVVKAEVRHLESDHCLGKALAPRRNSSSALRACCQEDRNYTLFPTMSAFKVVSSIIYNEMLRFSTKCKVYSPPKG